MFGPIHVILAIRSTSRTVIPNYHKMCGFSLSFIFFEAMMLHFSLAYQYLLSKSLTSYSSSMIFPFNCVAASWYILMTRHYPINLSWSDVNFGYLEFWFFAQYITNHNPIGCLQYPMPFVGEKNAYAGEIYIINYITASLFLRQVEAIMFIILQIFLTCRKTSLNSLLFMVWEVHFSVFSEMIW